METRDVLRATKRHWWPLVTVLVRVLGIAGRTTTLAAHQYAATVVCFVGTPSNRVSETYHDGLFAQEWIVDAPPMLPFTDAAAVAEGGGRDVYSGLRR